MRKIIKRTAFGVLTLMMMAAALLWQNSPVEAAANITWTTTDIVLEDGKCTVYGYFWYSDEKCPQFSGDKHWNVQRTIWTK